MIINCTEKCEHQKDGICVKNDCAAQAEYISGTVSCPHFRQIKHDVADKEELSSQPKFPTT
ncbi:MAG TPA: hypothetical protein DD733_09885 [Clostridiales bacterium]|nr:hypothetical protein [Eubacteriales bacterium]HBR32380.1 hypothetical protein [Clostridiales bacterium]